MKPSALIVTSGLALLLGACSEDFGVIEVTAKRTSASQGMQIGVCSQAQGDCTIDTSTSSTYAADPFNGNGSDVQTIAIKVGAHTTAMTVPTALTLFVTATDSANAQLSMASDPLADCIATTIPIKTGTTYKLTVNLDTADALTLSCAGDDMSVGTCQLEDCHVLTGFNVDLRTPDMRQDGGI